MDSLSDVLKVSVDFEQAHLMFPRIIQWLLAALALIIVLTHARSWLLALRARSIATRMRDWDIDAKRLLGCLALTPLYFATMEPVGKIAPNTGVGFLITSMFYVLALSRLFVHHIDRRKTIVMVLNALITPTLVWLVFAHVFRITLP